MTYEFSKIKFIHPKQRMIKNKVIFNVLIFKNNSNIRNTKYFEEWTFTRIYVQLPK